MYWFLPHKWCSRKGFAPPPGKGGPPWKIFWWHPCWMPSDGKCHKMRMMGKWHLNIDSYGCLVFFHFNSMKNSKSGCSSQLGQPINHNSYWFMIYDTTETNGELNEIDNVMIYLSDCKFYHLWYVRTVFPDRYLPMLVKNHWNQFVNHLFKPFQFIEDRYPVHSCLLWYLASRKEAS